MSRGERFEAHQPFLVCREWVGCLVTEKAVEFAQTGRGASEKRAVGARWARDPVYGRGRRRQAGVGPREGDSDSQLRRRVRGTLTPRAGTPSSGRALAIVPRRFVDVAGPALHDSQFLPSNLEYGVLAVGISPTASRLTAPTSSGETSLLPLSVIRLAHRRSVRHLRDLERFSELLVRTLVLGWTAPYAVRVVGRDHIHGPVPLELGITPLAPSATDPDQDSRSEVRAEQLFRGFEVRHELDGFAPRGEISQGSPGLADRAMPKRKQKLFRSIDAPPEPVGAMLCVHQ